MQGAYERTEANRSPRKKYVIAKNHNVRKNIVNVSMQEWLVIHNASVMAVVTPKAMSMSTSKNMWLRAAIRIYEYIFYLSLFCGLSALALDLGYNFSIITILRITNGRLLNIQIPLDEIPAPPQPRHRINKLRHQHLPGQRP